MGDADSDAWRRRHRSLSTDAAAPTNYANAHLRVDLATETMVPSYNEHGSLVWAPVEARDERTDTPHRAEERGDGDADRVEHGSLPPRREAHHTLAMRPASSQSCGRAEPSRLELPATTPYDWISSESGMETEHQI